MKPVWKTLLIALNLALLPTEQAFAQLEARARISSYTLEQPCKQAGERAIALSAHKAYATLTQVQAQQLPSTFASTQPQSNESAIRLQKLAEADKLYLSGEKAAAEKIYRSVKAPFPDEIEKLETEKIPEPITDAANLPPAARVYWRHAQEGLTEKLESKIMVPLKLLVEQYPQFIPGQVQYARSLKAFGKPQEALAVLERVTTLYPNQPEILKERIVTLADSQQWLEASVTARQFALINPEHPQAAEFTELAETNLEQFRVHLRRELRGNAIANGIIGVVSLALTGSPIGALSAAQTAALLLQGENALGERIASSAKRHLPLVEDKEVVAYVSELGQKLAKFSGRKFEYEFYVIRDKDLNAFALPGGKIFVNAGAILDTNSEAELAGLLSHELAHAVLSHAFQQVTQGDLLYNVARYIPLGGPLTDLLMLDYSRDQERQADILGTRLLGAAGYAADGLYNLMVTLKARKGGGNSFESFFSTHPATKERISYIASLIQRSGYNRYAYEGVERHERVKARLSKLFKGIKPDGEKKNLPQGEGSVTTEESQKP